MSDKKIKFLGLSIYKRKTKRNKTVFRILNVPVWMKVNSGRKKKYYFLGIKVYQKKSNTSTFFNENSDFIERKLNNRTAVIDYSISNLLFNLNRIDLKKSEKLRIHFLYIADSYWPSWESFYKSCIEDPNLDVKLIFLDTKDTSLHTSQYEFSESFLIKNNIDYIRYRDYFPDEEKPHVIVYQSPYNVNYDVFKKVRPDFIVKQGIRIVYIPYGIEYDVSINNNNLQNLQYNHLVHKLAWNNFVMHSDIKEGFYNHCQTGGSHVIVSGHPKFDCYFNQKFDLPSDLLKKAKNRKIVAIQIHCYNDMDCTKKGRIHSVPFEEHLKILNLLKEYKEYFFVYTIHPAYKTRNVERNFCSLDDYLSFVSDIKNSDNMYLYQGNHQALLANADAFITENSSLMIEMAFFDKSVLYLYDVPIAKKPFAQKIADTFHHGHTWIDVQKFIENILFKKDNFLELRKKYQSDIFPRSLYDGKIGFRIKERIIEKIKEESLYEK